jgi:outer membrane receptor for ferrienterochelin and colicins
MFKRVCRVTALFVFADGVQAAQIAAEPPAAVVQVTGTAATLRQNDTASRIVIPHDEIVKYGDASVLDVMKRLPGLSVVDAAVRMRGLGNGYTQLLVNGDRPPAGFSLESLALESIERIEILRAAVAELSTQSIAGTVNIVLKRAVAKPAQEYKANAGRQAGTRTGGANFTRSGKDGMFSYTAGGALTHTRALLGAIETADAHDSAATLTEQRIDRIARANTSTGLNLNANLNWRFDGGHTVGWQSFANASRSHGTAAERTSTILGPAYPYPVLDLDFGADARSLRSDVTGAFALAEGRKLDTRFGVALSQLNRAMAREAMRDQVTVLQRDFASDVLDNGVSWTGKYTVRGGGAHAWSLGWDLKYNDYRQHDRQADVAVDTPGFSFDTRLHAGVARLAGYAQDEWEVDKNLSVYLGMRWESIRTRADGAGDAPTTVRSSIPSPLLQALWKIPGSKKDQLRLALSRTYKVPQLSRLVNGHFCTTFNSAVSPDFIGNPALRPELATGIDLAYEHYWREGALFSMSGTTRRIRDLTRDAIRFDGQRWLSQQVNDGHATVRGLELESKFAVHRLVAMRASLARNWSRVDSAPGPGNRLAQQPRWTAGVGADVQAGAFSGGASFAFVSDGWVRKSLPESAYAATQRDLEAYLVYKVSRSHQLRVSAQNLLRTDGVRIGRYQSSAGRQDSAVFTPGYAGLRVQYEVRY